MEAIEKISISQDWVTLLFLGAFLLLVGVKVRFYQRFGEFIMLFATNKYLLLRNKDTGISHPFNIILFIINIISVSLFIYLFYELYTTNLILRPEITFLRIATAYASFILLKFSIEKIASNILGFEERMDSYQFFKLTYRNFLALVLIPINLILYYAWQPDLNTLYVLIAIILGLNLISTVGIFRKNSRYLLSNGLHFILYLCALEIGPYYILYKLITIA